MLTQLTLTFIMILSLVVGTQSSPTAILPKISESAALQTQPAEFNIEFLPVAPYHIGDIISIRVTYTGSDQIEDTEIIVALVDDPDSVLERSKFSSFSQQANFFWVLDTSDSNPGFINFLFEIPETGESWMAGINLLPTPPNRQLDWANVQTGCCSIHYFTGTDAAENILSVQDILESRANEALAQFFPQGEARPEALEDPLEVVLIPIVIGHGGFATDIAVITYSDRNWAGTDLGILSHHEIVHVLDRQLNPGPRPSLLSEGMAVYLAGGHYRPGDPLERAAALLALDWYLPISDIADNFYGAQHEIGYMEAAGLVAYLDQVWGWDTFLDFYFNLEEGEHDSDEISSGLQNQFGMDLAELEADFLAYLGNIDSPQQVIDDVRLTVETYDMIRRYQTLLIPSAHFQSAWWPPIDHMMEENIVGDYAIREKAPVHVIIEDLFLESHIAFDEGDCEKVEDNLILIDQYLSAIESSASPLSHYVIGWPLPELRPILLRP